MSSPAPPNTAPRIAGPSATALAAVVATDPGATV
jgi:hypothetical protein